MVDDDLAPCVARSSAAMVLTLVNTMAADDQAKQGARSSALKKHQAEKKSPRWPYTVHDVERDFAIATIGEFCTVNSTLKSHHNEVFSKIQ